MRYWITILLLVVIMIYEYRRYRYVLCATVTYPIMWIVSLVVLSFTGYYPVSLSTLFIIVIGYVLFCLGFHLICKPFNIADSIRNYNCHFSDHLSTMNLLLFISIAIGTIYLIFMRGEFSLFNFFDSFSKLYRADLGISSFYVYLSYIPKCSLWYFSLMLGFAFNPYNENHKYKSWFLIRTIILLVFNLIICIPGFSRTLFLFTFLPVLICFLIGSAKKNKTIIITFIIFVAAFLVLFISFNLLKHEYYYSNRETTKAVIDEFNVYVGGGIVALDQSRQAGETLLFSIDGFGKHTFSGIVALFDTLLGTNTAPTVLQNFIHISSRNVTNVYTIYHWAAKDFGLVYSIILQFVFGLFYGFLYRGIKKGRIMSLYWYSVMFYSLIVMFFQDQLFAVGQTFIVTIVGTIIVRIIAKSKVKIRIKA